MDAGSSICRWIFTGPRRSLTQTPPFSDGARVCSCTQGPSEPSLLDTTLPIWYVDHPNLYGLAAKPLYRSDHYLLWIGDFLNLPYLLRWKERTELPYELKVLTNGRRTSIKGMAMTLAIARRLGVELDVTQDRINGIAMYEWDPATQRAMMANTKAAVDIKGGRMSSLSSLSLRPRRSSLSCRGSRSPPTRTARLPETCSSLDSQSPTSRTSNAGSLRVLEEHPGLQRCSP